jgi:glycosyltransferase involved in cell wall biosynthesis
MKNVLFKDKWVEPKYVPYIVSQADVHVLNYMPGGFGHYGGSQSKSFQYMASGKPICCNIRMAYCPITKFNIGIANEFQSAKEYADAILSLVDMPKAEYDAMCLRAKEAAKQYDYEYLTSKMIEIF